MRGRTAGLEVRHTVGLAIGHTVGLAIGRTVGLAIGRTAGLAIVVSGFLSLLRTDAARAEELAPPVSLTKPAAAGDVAFAAWDWVGRPVRRPPAREWQKRKSPRVALVSSLLLPGAGQMYNERELWAAVAAGVEFYFIGNWIVEQRLTNRYRTIVNADPEDEEARLLFELHRDNRIQSTWLLGVSIVLSGLQAYVDAALHDFDETPLPIQVAPTPDGGGRAWIDWRF